MNLGWLTYNRMKMYTSMKSIKTNAHSNTDSKSLINI